MQIDESGDKLAIIFCALFDDWQYFKGNILKSFHNFNCIWGGKCNFILIIQNSLGREIEFPEGIENIKVIYMSVTGISCARNEGLKEAESQNCRWVIFHDASIFWPRNSVEFVYQNRYSQIPPRIKLRFSNGIDMKFDSLNGKEKKINPIYDTYVGAVLFDLRKLNLLRFNESHGPGEMTTFKSGEDVLFLFSYFSANKSFAVFESVDQLIFHPPRPIDYGKHKLYARGQGRVFRVLLSKYFSLRLALDCILFIGNAIVRCILLKKSSFSILRDRLAGLFDEV